MRFSMKAVAVLSAVALAPLGVQAADTLETLSEMHQTNTPVDWPTIPQTGPKADQVKQNLKKIKLPPGFHIDLYALVPDARHILY